MDPFLVVVIRSCICPISVERVGWYPTAEGIRPRRAETSDPAWVNLRKGRKEGKGSDEVSVVELKRFKLSKAEGNEPENVVNEEQHILSLLVSEVLGDRKTSKSDSGSSTGGLVHLSENESDLGVTVEAVRVKRK